MKATVLTENFREGLTFVNHAVSSRSQLPILLNFLIQAKKGELVISATDLEIGITVNVPAKTDEEGETTVPAKTLFDLISNVTQEKLVLSLEGPLLNITGEKIKTSFSTMPAGEFPKIQSEKGEGMGVIKKEDMLLLNKVVFAASQDSGRPALSGVLITGAVGGGTDVVAADGYRLSLLKGFSFGSKKIEKLLLPARVIKELLSQKNMSDEIKLFVSGENSQAIFVQDSSTLVGRLIEAEFPDYAKIVPHDLSVTAIFDKNEAQNAVRICSVFARDAANVMRLTVKKDKVIFSSGASSIGENSVEVEAKVNGEENEIAFNSRYLIDILSVMDGDSVVFEMSGPLSPGVFKEEGNKNFLHIIMPIRVQG